MMDFSRSIENEIEIALEQTIHLYPSHLQRRHWARVELQDGTNEQAALQLASLMAGWVEQCDVTPASEKDLRELCQARSLPFERHVVKRRILSPPRGDSYTGQEMVFWISPELNAPPPPKVEEDNS
jgi:hypothetical protein